MNEQDEKAVKQQLKDLRKFVSGKKWDVGLLATATLPFFLEELLVMGIESRPEVKRTLVKYTNANLQRMLMNVDKALKQE